jgi:hypothetical protein
METVEVQANKITKEGKQNFITAMTLHKLLCK